MTGRLVHWSAVHFMLERYMIISATQNRLTNIFLIARINWM